MQQYFGSFIFDPFYQLWSQLIGFVPMLGAALLVFILGLVLAIGLGMLVERLVGLLRLDALLARVGVEKYFERGGIRLNVGKFFGKVVYWFALILTLLIVSNIFGLAELSKFLESSVLTFIPKVAVAVLVMIITVLVAGMLRTVVRASTLGARLHAGKMLSHLVWWVVVVFGSVEAISQLGIDLQVTWTVISTLLTGMIAMLAIAGGIAFGLGGKEHASAMLSELKAELKKPEHHA